MKTKPVVCLFISLVLFCLIFTSLNPYLYAVTGKKDAPRPFDIKGLEKALDAIADIGGGRNYLTIMIDLPQPLPPDYKLYALALDRDEVPIRKVSSYMFDPEVKGKNHIWFYFFLYIPGGPRHELRSNTEPRVPARSYPGDYIKFILMKDNEIIMEKVVRRYDEWGNENTPLIIDIPNPPREIPGYLELKDYTFLAKHDYRKPEGYYIEGQIIGGPGTWNYFEPSSGILGTEPEPKVKLPSSQGWLELKTGQTHQMMEAIVPMKPYVNGWWDGKGFFHPDPVKIQ